MPESLLECAISTVVNGGAVLNIQLEAMSNWGMTGRRAKQETYASKMYIYPKPAYPIGFKK
jgi:hypothetical protein